MGVLERFTDGAREVVYLAIEEANELRHDCAGVEHVLLGLLRETDGLAAQVLRSLGVTIEGVRARLLEIDSPSAQPPPSQGFPLALTDQARRGLELAAREALSYVSRFVGTEHILLGLVGERHVAVQVLIELDVDAEKIRNAIPLPPSGRQRVIVLDGGALAAFPRRTRSGDALLRRRLLTIPAIVFLTTVIEHRDLRRPRGDRRRTEVGRTSTTRDRMRGLPGTQLIAWLAPLSSSSLLPVPNWAG
jgi:hypothetical protein